MSALGDSITRGFHSGSWLTCAPYILVDCPARSYATGTDSSVNSFYLRLRQLTSTITTSRTFNDAVTGAKVADLNGSGGQVAQAVGRTLKPELVTILIGANDACTPTEAAMTSTADFRSRLRTALSALAAGLPDSRIYAMSIPDIYQLWEVGRLDGWVRGNWERYDICQSMLVNPTSTATADHQRRLRVRDRVVAFNTAIREECDRFAHCRFDNNAGYNTDFGTSDLSNIDSFHPNQAGQQKAASNLWAQIFSFSDRTAPTSSMVTDRAPDGLESWYRNDVKVTLNASDASGILGSEYFYRLQGTSGATPWIQYSGPFDVRDEGITDVTFRAVDGAGNINASQTRSLKLDRTPPAVALTCPATPVLLGSAQTSRVAATDTRSGLVEPYSDPYRLDTSVPGVNPHRFEVQDKAGNKASASCTYVVRYADPAAPTVTDGATPNDGDFTVGWTAPAPPSYPLRYTLERRPAAGGAWEQVAEGLKDPTHAFTSGNPADEGTWQFRVKGVDATHGVETVWSAPSGAVTVDQTGPGAPVLSTARQADFAGDGGWFADTVDVVTTPTGDGDLRDGSAGSGVDPASVPGPHAMTSTGTVTQTVADRVGNVSPAGALRVQVDTGAPALALECPEIAELLDTAQAKVTASDDESGLRDDPSGTVAIDTTKIGPFVVERTAVDNVGHTVTRSCTVDVRYPTPGTPSVADAQNPNDGTYTVTWRASAPASYPLRYVVQRRAATDDAEWATVAEDLTVAELAYRAGAAADEGTWRYRVKGVDGDVETSWSEPSAPITVDQTGPAAPSITPTGEPIHDGWYRDQVTVTTTDNGDPDLRDGTAGTGVVASSVADPETLTASGTVRRTVVDRVGNRSAEASRSLKVDASEPSLALACPSAVVLRGNANVTVTASDGESGMRQDPSGVVAVDTSKVGPQLIERTAVDNVGHRRTERCTVQVRYDYGGLEQPVNRDGSSVFKAGSTVPLKFALTDAASTLVGSATPTVQLERISSTPVGTEVEDVVDAVATNGKAFTYDGTRYRFNLSTKELALGTWVLRIALDDGSVHRTRISLR
jgi:lysophospholipase L1-like esterase